MSVLQSLLNISQSRSLSQPRAKVIEFTPEPAYVIKTRSLTNSCVAAGEKVFLNICHSKHVLKPPTDDLLAAGNAEFMDMPVLISTILADTDKAGNRAAVIDCCINSTLLRESRSDKELQWKIAQTCLRLAEFKHKLSLSTDIVYPKLIFKGTLQQVVLDNNQIGPQLSLIDELAPSTLQNIDINNDTEETKGHVVNKEPDMLIREISTRRLR